MVMGKPGKAGARSGEKGCLLYSVDGGRAGHDGGAGKPGPSGAQGRLDVVRF